MAGETRCYISGESLVGEGPVGTMGHILLANMTVEGCLDLLWVELMDTDISVSAGLYVVGLVPVEGEVGGCSADALGHGSILEW